MRPYQLHHSAMNIRVLDPQRDLTLDRQRLYPTAYVPGSLIVPTDDIAIAQDIGKSLKNETRWVLRPDESQLPWRGTTQFQLVVQDRVAAPAADAWAYLQKLRLVDPHFAARTSINHVLTLATQVNPAPYLHSAPYTRAASVPNTYFTHFPQEERQPVAYAGPQPKRRRVRGRRPVVALLDTGCGRHPWLDPVVRTKVKLDGTCIGLDPDTGPEFYPDTVGPLDGMLDAYAGHGTFSAGLIHMAAPDADIVSWRVLPADGAMSEQDLINALDDVAELVRRDSAGEPGGLRIDVVSLSVGYYHETPDDVAFDSPLWRPLQALLSLGVIVVCAAGNGSTTQPWFPAAFAPWENGHTGPIDWSCASLAPLLSVGALNPNGTDALFSNAGPWVRAHASGAAVFSTMPVDFDGGLHAAVDTEAESRRRASIDPDDYSGGFGIWSGTSFAAPLVAGRLAAELTDVMCEDADPVERSREIVARVTGVVPQ